MGKLIWIILLGSGLSGLVVFLPLAIGGFEALINFSVAKELRITEGNVLWDKWKKAPIPVYFKARIFNLTNPEEIQRGSKPILNELGPYVYLETLEKFDITPDDETDTIRYRIVHTYHFRPELSNGSVDDMITFINIPLVGSICEPVDQYYTVTIGVGCYNGLLPSDVTIDTHCLTPTCVSNRIHTFRIK